MSNSVLDHLVESDQSETDSLTRVGESEPPQRKRIHIRDVLEAVQQDSPVKNDPESESNGSDEPLNSRKRRIVSRIH